MSVFLLDTNTISEPAKPAPDPKVLRRIEEHAGNIAIASIVWHELWFGVERLQPGRRRDYLRDYLEEVVNGLAVLPYDWLAARWHADQRAHLARRGITTPFVDGQIAAIAAVNEMALVTRNKADFAHFEPLRVVNWFEA